MQTNIQNKAVQAPPSLKGVAVLILDGDDFIVIPEQGYVPEPEPVHLSREQREALARKGIKLGGK